MNFQDYSFWRLLRQMFLLLPISSHIDLCSNSLAFILLRERDLFRRGDRIFLCGDRSFYCRVILVVFILLGIMEFMMVLLVIFTRLSGFMYLRVPVVFHLRIDKKFIRIIQILALYLECHLKFLVILLFYKQSTDLSMLL